jgi:hypothetical protein
MPILDKPLAQTDEPIVLEGFPIGSPDHATGDINRAIWFKSDPVTRDFCYRVAQLQLVTESHDQGSVGDKTAGSWSWFEVSIFPDSEVTEPRENDNGEPLSWRSHANRLSHDKISTHYGLVFDRRGDLLDSLEVGEFPV